jgi:hypothetical protein
MIHIRVLGWTVAMLTRYPGFQGKPTTRTGNVRYANRPKEGVGAQLERFVNELLPNASFTNCKMTPVGPTIVLGIWYVLVILIGRARPEAVSTLFHTKDVLGNPKGKALQHRSWSSPLRFTVQ